METGLPTSALRSPFMQRRFAIWLSASVGIHVVILAGYAAWDARRVSVLEMPSEPIKATLVKLGKKRDEKLLPRLNTAPPPPAPSPKEKAVPVKETPAPAEKAVPVPTKDDKKEKATTEEKDAREKSVQSALDRIREQVERDDARQKALGKIAERVGKDEEPDEGAEDGHPQGDSLTPSQVNAYLASMAAAVKRQYVVPSVITPQECARLVAQVMVRMDVTGTVNDTRIIKSSGSDLFDSAVVQAVKTASPLPAPPPNMRDMVTRGFGFNFRCAQ